jgi:cytochrome c oxidase accessory protein FixG
MLFDFGYFREQMCTLACPYGRFQSVMLDRQSLIISYDPRRGEPRGKMRRGSDPSGQALGDCVDCQACVTACPTGIDIRNGLQMECIGCAQCIDACDAVMSKIGRPTGLIRYSSQEAMEGGSTRWLRPRVLFYPAILLVIGALMAYMLARRPAADVTILRSPGIPFVQSEDGRVLNPLRLRITNRSDRPVTYQASIVGDEGAQLVMSQDPVVVEPEAQRTVGLVVSLPREAFDEGVHHLTLRVTDDQGAAHQVRCQLVGPLSAEGNDYHDRYDQ